MNSNTRLLLIGLSLTLVLSLSMSPVYAVRHQGTPKGWSGTQVAVSLGNTPPDISYDFDFVNLLVTMRISGAAMMVTRGYNFGSIHVDYEIITEETITIPMSDFLEKPFINIYDYPHSGSFRWYTGDPNTPGATWVGTGIFSKDHNGPPYRGLLSATLSVSGKEIRVQGMYWVIQWEEMQVTPDRVFKVPVMLNHAGLYITTE